MRLAVLLAAAGALALAGCTADAGTPTAGGTPSAPRGTAPAVRNDLADNSAHRTLKAAGEAFTVPVDYFLTGYDAGRWRTLAAKDVHVSVHVRPTGSGRPQVLVGAFAARVELVALDPALDGLVVATAADRPPAAVPGFLVTAAYPYDAVVPAGGRTAALADRWRASAGEAALSDDALSGAGVYANRLVFTYDLLVRNPGDAGWHKRTLVDRLTVPVGAGN